VRYCLPDSTTGVRGDFDTSPFVIAPFEKGRLRGIWRGILRKNKIKGHGSLRRLARWATPRGILWM